MNNKYLKLKHVYYPFLIIAIVLLVGYTFLNWLIIIKLQWISPKEIIIDLILPILLVWAVVYVSLRPRMKLLNLKKKNGNDNTYFIYILLSIVIISLPLVTAQDYLRNSTGQLVHLTSIDKIDSHPAEKYYKVDTCYMDKNGLGVQATFSVTGNGLSKKLAIVLYAAVPMYKHPSDPLNGVSPHAWYGLKFNKKIDNKSSKEEKESAFQDLLSYAETEISLYDFKQFIYLERKGNTNELEDYVTAIKNSGAYNPTITSFTLLEPENNPFENRLGNSFLWGLMILSLGYILFLIMVLIPKVDKEQLAHIRNKKRNLMKESALTFVEPLLPENGFVLTPLLILLNLIVFVIIFILYGSFWTFNIGDLIQCGAVNTDSIFEAHQWWRLLTSTFIHLGFLHFFINMVALYFVGVIIEPIIGKVLTLITYLSGGILASVVGLFWSVNPAWVSLGGTGSIMAMYGLFGAFLLTGVFAKETNRFFTLNATVFIIYNLLMNLTGDIGYGEHLGGFVCGFIIGLIIRFAFRRFGIYKAE